MESKSNLENTTKLIIGLGNPGTKYLHSRHNIGFWCVDRFAREQSLTFSKNTTTAMFAEGKIEKTRIILAKPQTYVNNSGKAVNDLLNLYGVSISSLLLVYDDIIYLNSIVTLNEFELVFPAESVAVQVTSVVPIGNTEPDE